MMPSKPFVGYKENRQIVIFSNMNSTLLEVHRQDFTPAKEGLGLITEKDTPLILMGGMTLSEIESQKERMGITGPFATENGGAVYIPKGFFPFPFKYDFETDKYFVKEFGVSYEKVLDGLDMVKKKIGRDVIKGFSEMSIEELAEEVEIFDENRKYDLERAAMVKERHYDEPFVIRDKKHEREISQLIPKIIKPLGLSYTYGGRYHHILGLHNKATAAEYLCDMLEQKYGPFFTSVGIGDSSNDFPLLNCLQFPCLVQKPDGTWASNKYIKLNGKGPEAWNNLVRGILRDKVSKYN